MPLSALRNCDSPSVFHWIEIMVSKKKPSDFGHVWRLFLFFWVWKAVQLITCVPGVLLPVPVFGVKLPWSLAPFPAPKGNREEAVANAMKRDQVAVSNLIIPYYTWKFQVVSVCTIILKVCKVYTRFQNKKGTDMHRQIKSRWFLLPLALNPQWNPNIGAQPQTSEWKLQQVPLFRT